ncbi:MAG: leucyl aminopeptidase [Candidatus Nanopelagicales bacterium]|nr:leucyl aminopeptidase [Candidatus Nanopelagicales bacterium]MDP5107832.1 leucyl aminopeptidase [Candidatus Nanopelagicales bacterium]
MPITRLTDSKNISTDEVLVVGFAQSDNGPELLEAAVALEAATKTEINEAIKLLNFTGKKSEITFLTIKSGILCVGLGKISKTQPLEMETLRRAAAVAARSLVGKKSALFALPTQTTVAAQAVAVGVELGAYTFTEFKTKNEKNNESLKQANILVQDLFINKASFEEAQIIAESVKNVRNLVNTPPSHMYPETFANYVKKSFKKNSKLTLEVLDERALKRQGYGAIIGVGQGSINPPRFIRLAYKSRGAKFHLALVGKGITFDTGGISLKPPASMHTMKCDMAGAATVVEALRAIMNLDLKINVTAYAALAENMPSASAQRPSDVVTTYGGKTIEVLNTDAEGRLVLADALARAQEDKPDLIIDLATLTGAATVALGSRTAGIMSNKDEARDQVFASAKETGESMWPMQIPEESRTILDSKTADIANVGFTPNPAGGMMVGAAFLNEFVDEKTPWVHIDIAPPAFNEGAPYGYNGFGGTGVGVRTLVHLAQKLSG